MKKLCLSVLILLFVVSSCNNSIKKAVEVSFQGEAQGTYYMVKYYDDEGRNFQIQVDSLLKAFDQSLSAWVPNSILSKVNRNEDVILDEYFIENFK